MKKRRFWFHYNKPASAKQGRQGRAAGRGAGRLNRLTMTMVELPFYRFGS